MTQTLDNLRWFSSNLKGAGWVDPPKRGAHHTKKPTPPPQQPSPQRGPESEDKAVSSLSASVQQRYSTLPNEAKRALKRPEHVNDTLPCAKNKSSAYPQKGETVWTNKTWPRSRRKRT